MCVKIFQKHNRAPAWCCLVVMITVALCAGGTAVAGDRDPREYRYGSQPWTTAINQGDSRPPAMYPEKRRISTETIRRTANEFYVPQISEFICKSMDCFDWLNQIDDPYLNRYKVDIEVDPQDERLQLFWKREF